MQVHPTVDGHVEHVLRDQTTVGDDDAEIRRPTTQCLSNLRLRHAARSDHLDAVLVSDHTDLGPDTLPAASSRGVGARDDPDHLVIGRVDQLLQGRYSHIGRSSEDDSHDHPIVGGSIWTRMPAVSSCRAFRIT